MILGVVKQILLLSFVLFLNITTVLFSSVYAADEEKAGDNYETVIQQIGVKNPATDLWRAVRQRNVSIIGKSQVQGPDAGTLIDINGQKWRDFRTSKLVPYSIYALGGVLLIIALFRLIRGKIKINAGRSGNKLRRFSGFQRFVHWSVATLFVILGITGVLLTLGRVGLVPLIGKEAFGTIASIGKLLHDYLGPVFAIMLVLMLFTFMKGNFPNWTDIKWFLKGGGLFGGHASAGRYNGGEKAWYWLAMIAGVVVVASGLILDFPVFDLTRENIKLSQIVHAIGAIGLFAVSFGHIFMGTIAMEGAFEAMQTGYCDENWAKEHHDLWYEDLRKQGVRSVGATSAVTMSKAMSEEPLQTTQSEDISSQSSTEEAGDDSSSVSSAAAMGSNPVVAVSLNSDQEQESVSGIQDSTAQFDNLKKIEGVGPKIEEILNAAGFTTYADIKNSNRDEIKAILDAAGPRYKLHEPSTWPQQAELAERGAWEELTKLQDELMGGS